MCSCSAAAGAGWPRSAWSSPLVLPAAAIAIAVTVVLFRLIGPSRTRLVAQILAAVIGAGFVIALQVAAILSYGTLSRFAVLTSDAAAAFAPALDSIVWWPARAALGDGEALLCLLAGGLVLLGAVMAIFSPRFADTVVSAAANPATAHQAPAAKAFRAGSRQQALRWKEFVLLKRDPWLLSQSLMQLLYLVPPALLLWKSFADSDAALVLITPVIVMAAGQLAGGLAWLTISGEDAPDLVATAPLPASRVTRAKIEVVLIAIAVIFAPLLIALAYCSAAAGGGHRARHYRRGGIGHRDPALVPGAGPAQPVPPPPDLVAVCHLRRSLFLDRLGRHRGAGAGAADRRTDQRPDHRGHRRGDMEDQPAAGLISLVCLFGSAFAHLCQRCLAETLCSMYRYRTDRHIHLQSGRIVRVTNKATRYRKRLLCLPGHAYAN